MFNYTVFFLCYDVVFHHLLDLLIYFFFSLVIRLVVLYCWYNNKNLLKYNKQQYGMYVASRVNNISTVIVIPYTTKVGCAMRIAYMYIYNPYHSALLLYVKNGYYQDCQYLGNLKQPKCNRRDSHLELQVYNNYCNHQWLNIAETGEALLFYHYRLQFVSCQEILPKIWFSKLKFISFKDQRRYLQNCNLYLAGNVLLHRISQRFTYHFLICIMRKFGTLNISYN